MYQSNSKKIQFINTVVSSDNRYFLDYLITMINVYVFCKKKNNNNEDFLKRLICRCNFHSQQSKDLPIVYASSGQACTALSGAHSLNM